MTYDEALAKLREWSAQIVTKPDNEMGRVLLAIEANHTLLLVAWKAAVEWINKHAGPSLLLDQLMDAIAQARGRTE
jgi:hypothetical protein